jgi:hypothetical protein
MEIYLSTLLLVMFTGGFELYVPGPGCVSTSPIIRINCNIYNRKTILCSNVLSGFIDVSVQTILKCSNGRTDFIPEMLNPNG